MFLRGQIFHLRGPNGEPVTRGLGDRALGRKFFCLERACLFAVVGHATGRILTTYRRPGRPRRLILSVASGAERFLCCLMPVKGQGNRVMGSALALSSALDLV